MQASDKQNGSGDRLFGCHIEVVNFIVGGSSGNSGGNDSRALRKPPSLRSENRTKVSSRVLRQQLSPKGCYPLQRLRRTGPEAKSRR
jgi:hypothetical protein